MICESFYRLFAKLLTAEGVFHNDGLAGHGMAELQFFGMEPQAVGRMAIEVVALDGAVEALGVGTVHAQLVGAPRVGIEGDECFTVLFIDNPVAGDGTLSVDGVNELARSVVEVGAERQDDGALAFHFGGKCAAEHCHCSAS